MGYFWTRVLSGEQINFSLVDDTKRINIGRYPHSKRPTRVLLANDDSSDNSIRALVLNERRAKQSYTAHVSRGNEEKRKFSVEKKKTLQRARFARKRRNLR